MKDINLIPQEEKPSKFVLYFAKIVNRLLILSLVGFLTALIVGVSVYYLYSIKNKEVVARQNELKNEISILEKSEQRLVLIKDRLTKIDSILKNSNIAGNNIDIIEETFKVAELPTYISGFSLSGNVTEVGFYTDSSAGMTKLLSFMVGSGKFSKIDFLGFQYTQTSGYNFRLGLNK